MNRTISLPLWLGIVVLALAAWAALEQLLIPSVRQPRARGTEYAPEDPDPSLQADQARGPDRPPDLRPAGPGGGGAAWAGRGHASEGGARTRDSLRPRDRSGFQRLRLFPLRLLARAQPRSLALPRAPGLLRRGGPRRDPA